MSETRVHFLRPRHHFHLSHIGVPTARLPYLSIPQHEYEKYYEEWKRSLPDGGHETWHERTLAHWAWAQHAEGERTAPERHAQRRKYEWWTLLAVLLLILFCVVPNAHCQFSKITYIDVQNQGSDIGFFTSPFKINFTGAGVACSNSSGTVTCTVTGGSITNNPGGSNTQIQYNSLGTFGGAVTGTYIVGSTKFQFQTGTHFDFNDPTDATKVVEFDASGLTTGTTRTVAFPDSNSRTIKNGVTTGQIPIWNAATGTFDVSDPLVQGTQAAASTTIPNPVVSGGSDYGGTPAVRVQKVDSSGNIYVGNFPSSFNVGNFPATQAVSSTQLPAALDGSGFFKVHEQGTAAISGTVTANIGTSGSLALDASVTGLQVSQGSTTSGEKGGLAQGAVTTAAPTYTTAQTSPLSLTTAGALRTDSSATTQPVSGTVIANQGGTWTVQPGNTANTTAWKVDGSAVTQPVSAASLPLPSGAATAANQCGSSTPCEVSKNTSANSGTNPINIQECDGTNCVTLDPCRINTNSFAKINQTANTQIITGTANKKTYICAINLVTAGANNVAIVEGTGTTCATGIAGVSTGGTTAATGWNFAANDGLTQGNGMGSIMAANNANADNVCILQSAAVQLSGVISYVQQ